MTGDDRAGEPGFGFGRGPTFGEKEGNAVVALGRKRAEAAPATR